MPTEFAQYIRKSNTPGREPETLFFWWAASVTNLTRRNINELPIGHGGKAVP